MFDSDRMTDWEFVFDGVVGFLTSPMWNVPIVTFIEKNCIGNRVYNITVESAAYDFSDCVCVVISAD